MYPVTSDTVQILNSNAKQTVSVTVTTVAGETFTVTEQDIPIGGLSVDRYSAVGNGIEIGTATAAELRLNLLNDDGKFNGKAFEGAQLFVRVWVENPASETVRGIHTEDSHLLSCESDDTLCMEDWNEPPADTVYPKIEIPIGRFTVDNSPRKLSVIQLTALDGMVKFDKKVDKSKLQFPKTVSGLLTDICDICGVHMADYSVQNLFNAEYEVLSYPETENLTYRQLLIWICQITCTCAYMDWDGLLQLKWYFDTDNPITVTAAQRFDSDLQEQSITVTGVQIQTDSQTVYKPEDENGEHDDAYVLCIQANGLIQQGIQELANAIGNKVKGCTYTPFSAKVFPMPYAFPMDTVNFVRADNTVAQTVLTNVNYTLNGTTQLAAKGETQTRSGYASLGTLTSGQRAIIDTVNKKVESVQTDLTSQESATLHLNQTAASAMGLYYKEVKDENGGVIRYWHDNESLENSLYICMQNAGGSFSTNTGWNNGNPQWTTGTDKFGNAVVNLLNTIGIQAEWIQADSITTDKLSIGQSERGTNLIEDSSFESTDLYTSVEYDLETDQIVMTDYEHNTYWNFAQFTNGVEYDPTPCDGVAGHMPYAIEDSTGFDGNKAQTDIFLPPVIKEGDITAYGFETRNPIGIHIISHTFSFYYRCHTDPINEVQISYTANCSIIIKIQWLNEEKEPISVLQYVYPVVSDHSKQWKRLYEKNIIPPNGTAYAKILIGAKCTETDAFLDDGSFKNSAFLDLDGILLEEGTELNAWTCNEKEVKNTGVIIDSNGLNIANGKIAVSDALGKKVLFTDGNQVLNLFGGLTTRKYNPTNGDVSARIQISPIQYNSENCYSNFLGMQYDVYNKFGQIIPLGKIGVEFEGEYDANGSFDPYAESNQHLPFSFQNPNGFLFNGTRPLICDPVEVDENIGYLAYVTSPGWYTVSTDAKAAAILQTPVPRAFFMQVFRFGNYVTQYFVSRIGETYQRTFDCASPDGVSGYNWTPVTGTYTQRLSETLYKAAISKIPPGTYIVDVNDIISVQDLDDHNNYKDIFPVRVGGILESFDTSDGQKYQRYTAQGIVYSRNSYSNTWTWWWSNGARVDN